MSIINSVHPTIWRLIRGFQDLFRNNLHTVELLVKGEMPRKNNEYAAINERISVIVRDFDNREPLDYLRGISYNYN